MKQKLETFGREYHELLSRMLDEGIAAFYDTRTGVKALSVLGDNMRFAVSKHSIPLLGTRLINVTACLAEADWFYQGLSELRPLEAAGCNFYRKHFLTDPDGNRTVGNYIGYALRKGRFGDQIHTAVTELRYNELSRRNVMVLHDTETNSIMPSCISTVSLYRKALEVHVHVHYRSCDVLVGLPNDVLSMYFLGQMIATEANPNFEVTSMSVSFANAHIYETQLEVAEGLVHAWNSYSWTASRPDVDVSIDLHGLVEYKATTPVNNLSPVV